jgi:hypothetical protein
MYGAALSKPRSGICELLLCPQDAPVRGTGLELAEAQPACLWRRPWFRFSPRGRATAWERVVERLSSTVTRRSTKRTPRSSAERARFGKSGCLVCRSGRRAFGKQATGRFGGSAGNREFTQQVTRRTRARAGPKPWQGTGHGARASVGSGTDSGHHPVVWGSKRYRVHVSARDRSLV